MQITRKEIEDMIMIMEANDILLIDADKPLKIDENDSPTRYILNEIERFHIVNILCAEYEITK